MAVFGSQGKGLTLETDAELRVDQLAAGGGERNIDQCAFHGSYGDFIQSRELIPFPGQKMSQMNLETCRGAFLGERHGVKQSIRQPGFRLFKRLK